MPTVVTLVYFHELLRHGERLGYSWNAAHDFLMRDEIPPMYESHSIEYDVSEIGDYDWCEDTIKLLTDFFEYHGLTKFTMVNS